MGSSTPSIYFTAAVTARLNTLPGLHAAEGALPPFAPLRGYDVADLRAYAKNADSKQPTRSPRAAVAGMTRRQPSAWSTRFVGTSPPSVSGKPDRRQPVRSSGRSEPSGTFPPCFLFVGGTDPDVYAKAKKAGRLNELPVNHSPQFAPVIHPTLQTGVEALVVAAQAWFSAQRTIH
jgi:hypothetical protein